MVFVFRFQDDDDIFGLDTQPSPRAKSPGGPGATKSTPAPQGMEWLEAAAADSNHTPSTTTSVASATPAAVTATPSAASPSKPSPSTAAVTPAKPPTPQRKASADAGSVTPQKPPVPSSNTAPSPRAWLGLGSDSDDDDLFKPKKSSARSAALPQSPALSGAASASPRVFPKKPGKKDGASPKPSPSGSAVVTKGDSDEAEEDDWLARAKSRRQQMLAKDSARSTGSVDMGTPNASARSGGMGGEAGFHDDGQSMKVDLSSLV